MKLKRILLDRLWVQRYEGIELQESLFKHLDVITKVNIGRNFKDKFGNPDWISEDDDLAVENSISDLKGDVSYGTSDVNGVLDCCQYGVVVG